MGIDSQLVVVVMRLPPMLIVQVERNNLSL